MILVGLVLSSVADSSCCAVARADRAGRVDAHYVASIGPGAREIRLDVRLSAVPRRLVMIRSAPRDLDGGWSFFVRDLTLVGPDGRPIGVTRDGADWAVTASGAGPATLHYRVQVQHDDTLPNGEPRWIRDRTMSEVGYAKDWGLFMTGAPMLVFPDSLGRATLELRVPERWQIVASWEPVPGSAARFELTGAAGFRGGMFAAGDIDAARRVIGDVSVRYAFGGPAMRRQAQRIETAVSRAFGYFVELMGSVPIPTPGTPLRTVMILLAEDPRRFFMGGGLVGTNFAMLEPPDAGWENLEGGVAHELFHLWNGFSFRNAGPGASWFSEGVTEYYAFQALRRVGTIDDRQWRGNLQRADSVYRADSGLGRLSVVEAGSQKFAHRGLTYSAGYLIAACLDADLRRRSAGRKSLDDVVRAVFRRYDVASRRYDTRAVAAIVAEIGGANYGAWFDRYVFGRDPLPANACGVTGPT